MGTSHQVPPYHKTPDKFYPTKIGWHLMGCPRDFHFAFPENCDNILFTFKGTRLPSKHSSV